MTTTDELPPLPEPHHIGYYGVARYSTCQMEDYATAARAPLLSELAALRSAVRHEADCVEAAKAEIDALRKDNENLRTVMIAAAEEISSRWDAHCDADGYGPANLMHRLEQGIPSQYGYTAGHFAALRERAESAERKMSASEAELSDLRARLAACVPEGFMSGGVEVSGDSTNCEPVFFTSSKGALRGDCA